MFYPLTIIALLVAGASEPPMPTPSLRDAPAPHMRFRSDKPRDSQGENFALFPAKSPAHFTLLYFGPAKTDDPALRDAWRAVNQAVADQTRAAHSARPALRIVPIWGDGPWGVSSSMLARAVYKYKPIAIIGGADSASAHVAEQVATKALIPMINLFGQDPGIHLANVPWIFSMIPDYKAQAQALAPYMAKGARENALVAVVDADAESKFFLRETRAALRKDGRDVARIVGASRLQSDSDEIAKIFSEEEKCAVFLVAPPGKIAERVSRIRGLEYQGVIYCGPALPDGERLKHSAVEGGLVFPVLMSAEWKNRSCAKAYMRKWGSAPSAYFAPAHDGARILAEAAYATGGDRNALRRTLLERAPWSGISGEIAWDSLGSIRRKVNIVKYDGLIPPPSNVNTTI